MGGAAHSDKCARRGFIQTAFSAQSIVKKSSAMGNDTAVVRGQSKEESQEQLMLALVEL